MESKIKMMVDNIKHIVDNAIACALANGADHARVTYSKSTQMSFSVIGKDPDRLNMSDESSMYIQLFADSRYGAFSTNQLEGREVEDFIKDSVKMTRLLAEDKDRCLPDTNLYFKDDGNCPDLCQYDSSFDNIPVSEKKKAALDTALEIAGKDSRLVYVSAEYDDSDYYAYMADSNGFRGESRQTLYSISCECSVKGDGDARPESWSYESDMFFDKLRKDGIGEDALKRALGKIGARKINSGKYTAVIESRVASRMVSPLVSALNGAALQQHNSFLDGKLGVKVFPEHMSLVDRPFEKSTPGARLFDGEGVATRNMDIIKNGVVNEYYITPYFSRKLKMPVTADGPSVLEFDMAGLDAAIGKDGYEEMMRAAGSGIFVTGFNGGNCNQSTGDFSFGVEGFYFEDGNILCPIKEMNLSGNMISLWNSLLFIGYDFRKQNSWHIPSLAFSGASFSGV